MLRIRYIYVRISNFRECDDSSVSVHLYGSGSYITQSVDEFLNGVAVPLPCFRQGENTATDILFIVSQLI